MSNTFPFQCFYTIQQFLLYIIYLRLFSLSYCFHRLLSIAIELRYTRKARTSNRGEHPPHTRQVTLVTKSRYTHFAWGNWHPLSFTNISFFYGKSPTEGEICLFFFFFLAVGFILGFWG